MKINNRIEVGREKLAKFVQSLLERNKVPDDQRENEQKRLEEMIIDRINKETLEALSDEAIEELDEATKDGEEFPIDKWNSVLFMEGIRPESIVGKVFREVEREYLGTENVETEETLMKEAEEGE
ncbi:hypothetical protein IKG06_02735 [Candidatus Saccharibacteria bacterium]|nr:hypothetical protein [Candidatus Saccharibacteria bacterium]